MAFVPRNGLWRGRGEEAGGLGGGGGVTGSGRVARGRRAGTRGLD